MKYVRTKNGITTSNTATHELTEHICCAGYFRTLEKGAFVRIGREWWDFYGSWVDIIDEEGTHYSIRPDEVKNVTKELPYADTISKLCDGFLVISEEYNEPHYEKKLIDTNALDFENNWKPYGNGKVLNKYRQKLIDAIIYGAIWTTGEHGEPILKSIAKMNNDGEFELL